LSPNAKESVWVNNEIGYAQTFDKSISPVLIAGDSKSAVPIDLITAQWVDGRTKLRGAVTAELLPYLKRRIEPVPPTPAEPKPIISPPPSEPPPSPPRTPYLGFLLTAVATLVVGFLAYYLVEHNPFQPPTTPAQVAENVTPKSATVEPTQPSPPPTATSTPQSSEPQAGTVRWFKEVQYVYVPAGEFKMGSDPQADALARDDEQPQHTLTLPGFWIMRTEVTNGQYKRCVEEGVCTKPENDRWNDPANAEHPVTNLTWRQAKIYGAWAGGRLPTEAEWEKACRGTDGRIYPWGDSAPTADLANFANNVGDITPVRSYSPEGDSPYGLVDMAGNVSEWTSSQYKSYPYDAADGRESQGGDASRTWRGGAWYDYDSVVRCAYRFGGRPDDSYNEVGFRLVSPGF
jgi:formylglycine-generating enzyme required for sulfatase activity